MLAMDIDAPYTWRLERVSDPLDLEAWIVVNHHVDVSNQACILWQPELWTAKLSFQPNVLQASMFPTPSKALVFKFCYNVILLSGI